MGWCWVLGLDDEMKSSTNTSQCGLNVHSLACLYVEIYEIFFCDFFMQKTIFEKLFFDSLRQKSVTGL